MRENREKSLLKNSILYFFGSLGRGIASILVVFIGSFFIDPSEMGIYDLVVSTITLLQPIIIFQINDGIYRWLLDESINKYDTIRCGYRIAARNIIAANIIMFCVYPFLNLNYKILIVILVNVNCIYPIFQQITRGLKNHRVFAVSGIFNAGIVLVFSYFLLVNTNLGIGSFYLSQIIANAFSVVYLGVAQKLPITFWNNIQKDIEKSISIPMQKYSILLVPNSINQWIMKALDKYCILFYLTSYSNGIYTVAHRLPDVLIMLNNMFYSAWVEQSIVEYNSEDRDSYFSKIFNLYSSFLLGIILIILPVTKYVLRVISGEEYGLAYKYVPFLYIAVAFSGMSSFIGTGYLGTKKTEGIMWTSLAGAFTNTIINLVLMKRFGLQIAGISSICAYAVMLTVRIIQTKKFFTIKIDYFRTGILVVTAFMFAVLIQKDVLIIDIIMEIIAVLIFFVFNWKMIASTIKVIKRKLQL